MAALPVRMMMRVLAGVMMRMVMRVIVRMMRVCHGKRLGYCTYFIHSDRGRGERLPGGGARSTATGVDIEVHEDRERRATPPGSRAVDLCRYV